jgi:two-component system cell cycle sensor histidine kinase/response regulator CckA
MGLSGDATDIGKPEYRMLKEQLTRIRTANSQFRFVYLMGRRPAQRTASALKPGSAQADATLFFFVDSESPDSKDYSPPGQMFEGASDEFRHVFRSGIEATEGPSTDQWGTWVSASVPIRNPHDGRLLAVLGMDVDAHTWRGIVISKAVWPAGLTLAGLLLMAGSIALAQSRRRILVNQAAWRASERNFQSLFRHNPSPMALTSISDQRIVEANDAFLVVSGYALDEVIGRTSTELGLLGDPEQQTRMRDQLLDGKTIANLEMQIRRKDGLRRVGLFYGEKIVIQDRGYILTTMLDISDRVRTEQELKSSEEKYRTVVENTTDIILTVDRSCRIITINHPPAGLSVQEAISSDVVAYVQPEHQSMVREVIGRVFETGEPARYEITARGPNGTVAWYETQLTCIRHDHATPHVMLVTRDITERKRLEAQFLQAQKMESIGRLAGGVAHDFNNMISVILGQTEMALDGVDPTEPLFTSLHEIRNAARRSADLTRQLLAFARKQAVAPRVLDLNKTVEEMLKMLQRLIGEDIALVWKPGRDVAPVRMDPSQINQILANLCVNARDAIRNTGNIIISTTIATLDAAFCASHAGFAIGTYVALVVSDDGCGMDTETLSHLFEPFFTTKEIGKGTGLGLATVYGIVKQNHGYINVNSEPGHGATVTIYLPLHLDRTEQGSKMDAVKRVETGGETILLVEDEPAILKMTRAMLERQHYTVLTAGTPEDAMRIGREYAGHIHLLVTDVIMPEMNGRELARNLISLYPQIGCLFMSGYTADVITHHGVLEEGVHFIQKPFSVDELAAKVQEALDGAREAGIHAGTTTT